MTSNFYTDQEKEISHYFLQNKYIIVPAEDMTMLKAIQKKVANAAAKAINRAELADEEVENFLNTIHKMIPIKDLNTVRLKVIADMNKESWFRHAYYSVGRGILNTLVGNELAMQRKVNLSIQFPDDDSSLLPVHADVWAGDSPYEIVLWIPLVNCYATKSMYISKAEVDEKVQSTFNQFKNKSSEDLYQSIKEHVEFLNVPFGHVLLFSQNVMHGNRVNQESETRWSMNCRFKNVLTPYWNKKLGDFFEPITIRPATRLGMSYKLPEAFHD